MDSTDITDDLELLAAFIDGRLSGKERARAVKLLADSDDALELYAQTVRGQAAPSAAVVPITTARRWIQWRVMVPVAAAAVLAVVLVPRVVGRGTSGVMGAQFAMELTRDPRFAGALHDGWEARGWTVTRGALPRQTPGTPRTGSAVESGLAFRLGVRSVDLQIALRRGDTTLADRLTSEVIGTLRSVGFSELVAARYTELKTELATNAIARSLDRASDAERELRDLLGSSSFVFGQWVAAADLAAQAHDASFFESSHGTTFIRSTMPAGSLTAEDSDALRSIDTRMSQDGGRSDRALDDVHASLQTVIRRRGS